MENKWEKLSDQLKDVRNQWAQDYKDFDNEDKELVPIDYTVFFNDETGFNSYKIYAVNINECMKNFVNTVQVFGDLKQIIIQKSI